MLARPRRSAVVLVSAVLVLAVADPARGEVSRDEVLAALKSGLKRLAELQQEDGSWRAAGAQGKDEYVVGRTALATRAAMRSHAVGAAKVYNQGLEFILRQQQD
ncbi:unnamed protein product, partial [marine sediment metagenome]